MFYDSIKDPLGFNARTLYEEYTPSDHLVDILSFDNIFLECNIAQGMIFKGKRSGTLPWMSTQGISVFKNSEVLYNGI